MNDYLVVFDKFKDVKEIFDLIVQIKYDIVARRRPHGRNHAVLEKLKSLARVLLPIHP